MPCPSNLRPTLRPTHPTHALTFSTTPTLTLSERTRVIPPERHYIEATRQGRTDLTAADRV
eukprot:1782292-Pyramimonas_sp.AAC.1